MSCPCCAPTPIPVFLKPFFTSVCPTNLLQSAYPTAELPLGKWQRLYFLLPRHSLSGHVYHIFYILLLPAYMIMYSVCFSVTCVYDYVLYAVRFILPVLSCLYRILWFPCFFNDVSLIFSLWQHHVCHLYICLFNLYSKAASIFYREGTTHVIFTVFLLM